MKIGKNTGSLSVDPSIILLNDISKYEMSKIVSFLFPETFTILRLKSARCMKDKTEIQSQADSTFLFKISKSPDKMFVPLLATYTSDVELMAGSKSLLLPKLCQINSLKI